MAVFFQSRPKVAAGKTTEEGRPADVKTFSLERIEYLLDGI
jgi:hypothetical protein